KSDPDVAWRGLRVANIAGVHGARQLDEHREALGPRRRLMLISFGHHEHLAGANRQIAVAKVNGHRAVDDDEDLVGVAMAVPDELAAELDELELVVVHPGNDLRRPMIGEGRELLSEVDGRSMHKDVVRIRLVASNVAAFGSTPTRTPTARSSGLSAPRS